MVIVEIIHVPSRKPSAKGAVGKVLPGVKAPSTLGTFLRAFTFGHVRQLGAVAAAMLSRLAVMVNILAGHDDHRDAVTWLDVDVRHESRTQAVTLVEGGRLMPQT